MSSYLAKIRDFVQGNLRYFNQAHNSAHINEQAMWRAFLCQDCLKAGKCRICHCKTPNMFYSPNKVDSGHKWSKMLSETEWEKFKTSNAEYKMLEKALKLQEEKDNVGNRLYQQQQELLGYTPPLNDPVSEFHQTRRKDQLFGVDVGDSTDTPLTITVLQSTKRGEDESSEGGLPGIGGETFTVQLSGDFIPGSNNDSGTEIANNMEEED